MVRVLVGILLSGVLGWTYAQEYIPLSFQRAVKQGTRTYEGVPGAAYFQNRTAYSIEVDFNPRNGKLQGQSIIDYRNNSQDTLMWLVLRVYQNINKTGAIRDDPVSAGVVHSGVEVLRVLLKGDDLLRNNPAAVVTKGTVVRIYLDQPLLPGQSVKLELHWAFTVPQEPVRRYGKYHKGTYLVALWYPQVAVYDDLDGWDEIPYTGTNEFYNDCNSFDVRIRVPASYMVWATGQWLNRSEILTEELIRQLSLAETSDTIVSVLTPEALHSGSWSKKHRKSVYHYQADSVPDFAFGVSDRYLWDAGSVQPNPASEKRVQVAAAYPAGAPNFYEVAGIAARIIVSLSQRSYGVEYPYPGVTVFNGADGMEYPMIVNNGAMYTHSATVYLAMHEIAHAYFPFLTGINEHVFSWMDEGLTTYLPLACSDELETGYFSLDKLIRQYNRVAGSSEDVPLQVPSYCIKGQMYQNYSYIRPSVAFAMLETYMGEVAFREGVSDFIQIWQYKHATPYDLFATLQHHTSKDLEWVITPWFFGSGWPDLAVRSAIQQADSLALTIEKLGAYPVPVLLELYATDGSRLPFEYPMEVWKNTNRLQVNLPAGNKTIQSVHLGSTLIPDTDLTNNRYVLLE